MTASGASSAAKTGAGAHPTSPRRALATAVPHLVALAAGALAAALVSWALPSLPGDPFRTTLAILPLAAAAAFSIERWARARGLASLHSRETAALVGALAALAVAAARAPSLGLAAADPLIAVGLLLVLGYWVARLLPRLRPLLGASLPRRPHAIFFWLPFLVYASLIPWTTRHRPPDGDEPYNLLIAHSLVFDRDVDLANNYRDGDARRFLEREIAPQLGDPHGPAGEVYSRHNLLLPLVLALPYRIAGRGGALVAMAALTALLASSTLRLARRYFPDRPGEVLAAWSVVSFLPPLLLYSSQIWVEVPAALLVVYGLDRVHAAAENGGGRRAVLGLAAAILLLPLVKIRLTLLAMSLLALFCWRAVVPALRRPLDGEGPEKETARPPSQGAGGHGAALSGVRPARPSDRRRALARQERVGPGNGGTVSRGDPSPHVERNAPPRLPGGRGSRQGATAEARARALTALALAAVLALLATAILLHNQARFGNPLKVHTVAELDLTTHPVERYLRGLGGLFFDGAFGLFACAPIWLVALPALGSLLRRSGRRVGGESRGRLLVDAAFVAVPYLIFVAPRGEWYGGWSPPFRYGLAFLPLLGIALTQAFVERRRPVARVVLAALGGVTIVLTLLWVSAPGWTYNFANGTSRVIDHLESHLTVDVARLAPSYVRTRAAVWWGPFAAVLLALLWWIPGRGRPRAALGATFLLVAASGALIGAARMPTRTIEVEDAYAEKSGGDLNPPIWTIDRWRYRGAWLLPEGERIVMPVASGGERVSMEIEARYVRRRHPPLTLRIGAGERALGAHAFVEASEWKTVRLGPFEWPAGAPLVLEATGPDPPADDPRKNRVIIDRVRLVWQ